MPLDVPRPDVRDYPHIARCQICRVYLAEAPEALPSWAVVSAALGFHDSGHRHDPLDVDTRFGWI